ncbi:MAG: DUF2232 domain-containing protein [Deltaproteobacteria bacterium]|nr:DUF2232 domain-containing protein [Deltaproteobacteria bacterium]
MFVTVSVVPVMGSLSAVLVPLPLLYYYSRFGRAPGVIVFGLALLITVIVSPLTGSAPDIRFLILSALIGPVLSETLRKNYSVERTVVQTTGIILLAGCSVLLYESVVRDFSPWRLIETSILEMVRYNLDAYPAGEMSRQIEFIRENAPLIAKAVTHLFPGLVIAATAFSVWVNILEGRVLFTMRRMWYPDFGTLSRWKAPDSVVWLLIGAGVFIIIPLWWIRVVGFNMMIVLFLVYLLQGVAIVSYYFQQKNIPLFFRGFAYFMIFAQQFLLLVVIGLGIVDIWADFRKLNRSSQV